MNYIESYSISKYIINKRHGGPEFIIMSDLKTPDLRV